MTNLDIIKTEHHSLSLTYRKRFQFIPRNTPHWREGGTFDTYPCILLIDKETGDVVAYTEYEKYLVDMAGSDYLAGETLFKRATAVTHFLNYLLYQTNINEIAECDLNVIRNGLIDLKISKKRKCGNGVEDDKDGKIEYVKQDTFAKNMSYVKVFLRNYYTANRRWKDFGYKATDLEEIKVKSPKASKHSRKSYKKGSALFIEGLPKNSHKKNRYLPEEYLFELLKCARRYDPMLALAIAIQAFASPREGEIVNMTISSFYKKSGALNTKKGIIIKLEEGAPFFRYWEGKTQPGSRKKPRDSKVYFQFYDCLTKLYEEHIQLLKRMDADTKMGAPLFLNKWGKPMTVYTYTRRLKDLFYNNFLPHFKKKCLDEGTISLHAPYIDAFEKEYPGAHMLRGWFTMYLLENGINKKTGRRLTITEIQKFRGDEDPDSMLEYITIDSEIIESFRNVLYDFQRELCVRGNDE